MKGKLSVIALVSFVAGGSAAQGSILIDDFSTTSQAGLSRTCQGDIGFPVASTAVGGGILGGERDIRVDLISGPNGQRISVLVLSSDSYNHSQDGGVKGTSMCVWDGMDGNGLTIDPTGLGGIDLTQNGLQDALEVNIFSADLNSKLVYEVFTDAGNSSKFTLNLPGGAASELRVIPYSSFLTNLGVGADFTNVGAISMLVDGSTVASLDVVLDVLQTTSTLTATKAESHLTDLDFDGLVDVGEKIRYTVAIENPDDAQNTASPNVHFGDDPPSGTTLDVGSVATTQGVVITGNTDGDASVAVNIGDIADGVTVTVTFDVTVNTGGPPEVCNQGFVTRIVPELYSTSASSLLLNLPTDDPSTVALDDPTCTPISYCGDGILDPNDEDCDDGNTNDNDACTNACTTARCGDGIVETGVEECDDGNLSNNDACLNNCTNARCGDGIVETGVEQCDDGNTNDNDACTNACTTARCGDGIVETGVEQCDDGNTNNNDACTNACTTARCGDGIVETGVEQCDDGNTNDNDACSNNCTQGCGNGIVNTGEECDGDANAGCFGQLCLADCTCEPPTGAGACCDEDTFGGCVVLPASQCTCAKCVFHQDMSCEEIECVHNPIPTVSQWGLVVLTLLLLTGAKVYFGRRQVDAA